MPENSVSTLFSKCKKLRAKVPHLAGRGRYRGALHKSGLLGLQSGGKKGLEGVFNRLGRFWDTAKESHWEGQIADFKGFSETQVLIRFILGHLLGQLRNRTTMGV